MDIYCMVTEQGLKPMYDSDHEAKRRLKVGTVVRCTVTKARNYAFHKKFFALLRLTFENLPEWAVDTLGIHTEEDMLRRFKLDLGLFDTRLFPDEDGGRVIEYKSISFAEMDNTDFEKFYNGCLNLVVNKYLQGVSREDVMKEVDNFR